MFLQSDHNPEACGVCGFRRFRLAIRRGGGLLRARSLLLTGLVCAFVLPEPAAAALDEVVLKNGRRYLGTILVSTPDYIVLSIDEGTVRFPRSTIESPPYSGPFENVVSGSELGGPAASVAGDHPLPSISNALQWLAEFKEGKSVRQVPVMVTENGRWRHLPAISFWVNESFQLTFFGDPQQPAAIEASLHHPELEAWTGKRILLEYMFGLTPGLAVDERFERLNIRGDSFAVGELWFSVTDADGVETPGRWSVLLVHDRTLANSRASLAELEAISDLIGDAVIDPDKPRSWQQGYWTPDEIRWSREAPTPDRPARELDNGSLSETEFGRAWTGLGGDRVFVRAYVRTQGRYQRSDTNWLDVFDEVAR